MNLILLIQTEKTYKLFLSACCFTITAIAAYFLLSVTDPEYGRKILTATALPLFGGQAIWILVEALFLAKEPAKNHFIGFILSLVACVGVSMYLAH